MKIGIIDSGKGGLELTRKLKRKNRNIILIMDKAFFPYGLKTKEFLCKRILYLCEYLQKIRVDLIILGCNTASIYALNFVKKYIKVPVLGVFELLIPYLYGNGLFIGSKSTVEYVSENYPIQTIDGTLLIKKIEKNENYVFYFEEILNKYMNINYVVLGCTHLLCIDKNSVFIEILDQLDGIEKNIKMVEKST